MNLNPTEKIIFKEKIKTACIQLVEQRLNAVQAAMDAAQESANGEGKSSAGDKYETSRAMGQLDRDMNAKQLEEAKKELEFIKSINVATEFNVVTIGAVVICSNFIFFVSAGLGIVMVDDKKVVLLSPIAPIAKLLNGQKLGAKITFNGNDIYILDVF
jgi:transcription elongation GreA/GreB family factor